MDPFSEEHDQTPERPAAKSGRPWWRWNPFVLAGALFAVLWMRELFGLPLGGAVVIALLVIGAWVVGPAIATGQPLINAPVRPRPSSRRDPRRPRWVLPRLCQVAAVLVAAAGVLQGGMTAWWTATQYGPYQTASLWWSLFVYSGFYVGVAAAMAIALWTIGYVAARVDEIAQRLDRADEDRDRDDGEPAT